MQSGFVKDMIKSDGWEGDCREENHRTEGPDLTSSENSSRVPNFIRKQQ